MNSIIDPADLNDPAKAEAFLRETIDDLTAQIKRLNDDAERQLCEYINRHGEDAEAVLKYTRVIERRQQLQVEPLRAHREALNKIIERVATCTSGRQ